MSARAMDEHAHASSSGALASRLRPAFARLPHGLVAVPLLALALWPVYGVGYVEYDAAFALVWGGDLAAGRLPPDLRGPVSPTPHPLATLVGAAMAPLGPAALPAVGVLSIVMLAALGWSAFRLGRALCTPLVGALFGVVLLTRPLVVKQGLAATVDVPFLALVLGAAALEADRPRRAPVLALLAAAGLLRPEAWLLSAAYLAYLWPGRTGRARLGHGALAATAPLGWVGVDLLTTGDPLHSLHWTGAGAERLGRPTGVGTALLAGPGYLRAILGGIVLAGGLFGVGIAMWRLRARAVPPLVLGSLMVLAFLASGAAGLAVLPRYLLAPAAVLALTFAVAATGWRGTRSTAATKVWTSAGVALVAALLGSLAVDRGGLGPLVQRAEERRAEDGALRSLAAAPAAGTAVRRCRPIRVHYYRLLPLVAYIAHERPGALELGPPSEASTGVVLVPVGPRSRTSKPPGDGFRRLDSNGIFAVYARCGGTR